MGIQKTRVNIHGVPVDITDDRMESFFARYEQVEDVSVIIIKARIATRDLLSR